MPRRFHLAVIGLLAGCGLITGFGCWPEQDNQVVVYTALDREFSQPIFDRFTEQTGVQVLGKFDTESTKTVGLYNAIQAEAARPRCDVFWNNEILNTLRLQQAGLLAPYAPAEAEDFPAMYRSPQSQWHGFAARARVLIVNTSVVAEEDRPQSILELADPNWQGQVGIAKPLFGTTATHAAVLFHEWGAEAAQEFFQKVRANAQVMAGNKQVALAVARGQLAWGITDTDDAIIEVEKGMPVAIVYPDQGPDEMGTLFIPNCVAIIQGGPHPQPAQRLVDYLLSAEVEQALAAGPSAQIPLRTGFGGAVRVATPETVKTMQVDFPAAVKMWDRAAEFLQQEFSQ